MRIPPPHPLRRHFPALAPAVALVAQLAAGAPREIAVEIPKSVPLEVVSSDFAESDFEPRGAALVIELAGSIRFRHEGPNAVRAVTLAVDAHRGMMGGRAAVSVPSLDARKGEEFEVRINLRLLRPLPLPSGPVVRIAADAVLFDTFASVGPDRLDSVRKMKTRELEARRDREFFLSQWKVGGRDALAAAMQASLRRQAARPRLDIRFAGVGPATAGRVGPTREIELAFVQDAEAPLVLESGSALVTGSVSDAPRIRIRNRTKGGIRQFDVGWLIRDGGGTVYSAGSVPAEGDMSLEAEEHIETHASRRFVLRPLGNPGQSMIEGMGAYLRSAQMDDGSVWIPSRQALEASHLLQAVPVSAEERRLAQLYRERGPMAVADELRKFAGDGHLADTP